MPRMSEKEDDDVVVEDDESHVGIAWVGAKGMANIDNI